MSSSSESEVLPNPDDINNNNNTNINDNFVITPLEVEEENEEKAQVKEKEQIEESTNHAELIEEENILLTIENNNSIQANPAPPETCQGIPGATYGPFLKFFSKNAISQIFNENPPIFENSTWLPLFSSSCLGQNPSSGTEPRCQECSEYQTSLDGDISNYINRDNTAINVPKNTTEWSVLENIVGEVKTPKNCILEIIQNSLSVLQAQPQDISNLLDPIKKKLKTREVNLFMDSKTMNLFNHIITDCKTLVKRHAILKDLVTVQSAIRGRMKRKHYYELKDIFINSPMHRRNKIFRDIVRKEGNYCKNLNIIVQDYLGGLRELALKKKPILSDSEIQSVFGNIELILDVHLKLYRHLTSLQTHWPNIDGIGQVILRVAPSFREYGKYVQHIITAISSLKSLQSQKEKFNTFLQQRADTKENELHNLLMIPLNQMTEYQMYLMRLIEVTPPSVTLDYVHQPLAHAVVEETSKFIRNQLLLGEDSPVDEVAKRIKKSPVKLEDDKRRKFVKEGPSQVTLTTEKQKTFKGYLFLFDDILLICKASLKPPYKAIMRVDLSSTILEVPRRMTSASSGSSIGSVMAKKSPSNQLLLNLTCDNVKISLSWNAPADHRDWNTLLGKQIANHQKKRVFGVNLMKLDDFTNGLPTFVVLVIRHLFLNGITTEGIFRIAGSQNVVTQIKEIIDKGLIRDLKLTEYEPADIAALLKMFFREMIEPLIPYPLYDTLLVISNQHESGSPEMIGMIREQILTMPSLNYRILEHLMFFLKKVSEQSQQNKMRAMNLAICFSPNLLRPKKETIEFSLNITKSNAVIEAMIEYYNIVFNKNHETDTRLNDHVPETSDSQASQASKASQALQPSPRHVQEQTEMAAHEEKSPLNRIRAQRSQSGLTKILPIPLQNLLSSPSSSKSRLSARNISTPSSPILNTVSTMTSTTQQIQRPFISAPSSPLLPSFQSQSYSPSLNPSSPIVFSSTPSPPSSSSITTTSTSTPTLIPSTSDTDMTKLNNEAESNTNPTQGHLMASEKELEEVVSQEPSNHPPSSSLGTSELVITTETDDDDVLCPLVSEISTYEVPPLLIAIPQSPTHKVELHPDVSDNIAPITHIKNNVSIPPLCPSQELSGVAQANGVETFLDLGVDDPTLQKNQEKPTFDVNVRDTQLTIEEQTVQLNGVGVAKLNLTDCQLVGDQNIGEGTLTQD
eukprot:TRINITY_DN2075_c0_g1_i1.p1 TRINITY_DN2075_c0_g1~~TRINITY_DN2075_c0_g1_i1.p1  ORF type:complete len:1194 (+),score=240.34 TRINITY_DN2075_c0_g1_i1:48-3629(+)